MKLTKFEHSCFTVEKDGEVLVVDPGNFTSNFVVPSNVVAVVVTHEHQDHFEMEKLRAIVAANPTAKIYAHEDITKQMEDLPAVAVHAGETVQAGNFTLEFSGGRHATIHPSLPVVANLAVMIDGRIYHPGDALTLPERPVEILILPVSAPWLKISEAIDFLNTIQPTWAFPAHDEILSDIGKSLHDRVITMLMNSETTTYERISGEREF